jgi:ubiquinone biosynthesis protein
VRETLRSDIRNFRRLARLADWLEVMGEISVLRVIEEFATFTEGELDFVCEASTCERLGLGLRAGAYVPRIYWGLTTSRVLAMEFIDGVSVSFALEAIESKRDDLLTQAVPGHRIEEIIRAIAAASFNQLFVTGFFHGDPHPGNVLIRRDGTVVFVDFGIFGQLSRKQCQLMARFVESVALGNIPRAYWHCARLSDPTNKTDVAGLRRETMEVLSEWHRASEDPRATFAEKHLGRYFGALIGLMRKYRVRMGVDLVLFWRTLLLLDAVAIRVADRFDLAAYMREFFQENGPRLGDRLIALGGDEALGGEVRAVGREGPRRLRQVADVAANRNRPRLEIEGTFDDRRRSQRWLRWSLAAIALLSTTLAWIAIGR